MKTKREISDEILRFKIANNVAKEHGYFALSSILENKIEGMEYAFRYNDTKIVEEKIKVLEEKYMKTVNVEKTNEILNIRAYITNMIKSLEWAKVSY